MDELATAQRNKLDLNDELVRKSDALLNSVNQMIADFKYNRTSMQDTHIDGIIGGLEALLQNGGKFDKIIHSSKEHNTISYIVGDGYVDNYFIGNFKVHFGGPHCINIESNTRKYETHPHHFGLTVCEGTYHKPIESCLKRYDFLGIAKIYKVFVCDSHYKLEDYVKNNQDTLLQTPKWS